MQGSLSRRALVFSALVVAACVPGLAPVVPPSSASAQSGALGNSRQLIVVTTPDWNATTGVLRRFERNAVSGNWAPVAGETPVVVGRTGLAWADAALATTTQPVKREGDGKSPAGIFPLDTAFGFAPADSMRSLRVPYVALQPGSDCVDDDRSMYYNTVVDRARVPRIDWSSAEHMRQISVYRIGVIVGYNAAPPQRGRGSCIFLHIWSGPASVTAGCTAFDAAVLNTVMHWLDRDRHPVIVQLPQAEYARLRSAWGLPG